MEREKDEAIRALLGRPEHPEKWPGLDLRRPVGLYAATWANNPDGLVVLLPVADRQRLRDHLRSANLFLHPKDGESLPLEEMVRLDQWGFRLAHDYAYLGRPTLGILRDPVLLRPAEAMPPDHGSTLEARLHLDLMPEAVLRAAKEGSGKSLRDQLMQVPFLPEPVRRFQEPYLLRLGGFFDMLYADSRTLAATAGLTPDGRELRAEFTLEGVPGTEFDQALRAVGQEPSLFGGFLERPGVARALLKAGMTEDLRADYGKSIEAAFQQGLKEGGSPEIHQILEFLFANFMPILREGRIDAGLLIVPGATQPRLSGVLGIKVPNGPKVDQGFRSCVQRLLSPQYQEQHVRLEAARVGNAVLHRFDISWRDLGPLGAILETSPLWVGIRDDALYIALGQEGRTLLDWAVTLPPKPSPVIAIDVEMAPVLRMFQAVLGEPFPGGFPFAPGDPGKLHLSLAGGPQLRARAGLDLTLVRTLIRLGSSQPGMPGKP